MRKIYFKIKEYVPIYAIVFYILCLISLGVLLIEKSNSAFADFINSSLSVPIRAILAFTTAWFPVSLAECLVLTSPVWAGVLLYVGIKRAKKGLRETVRYILFLSCILCFIFLSFVWTYSSGYYTSGIDKKLGMERKNVAAEDLYDTAIWLRDNLNDLSEEIKYDDSGASLMEYSYDELSKKLYAGYSTFAKKTGVISNFPSRIKPIMMSEPMTYTHLSGIYSFMTGEANVNINYPDFIVASSSAHELAHQRGIAREDEANFVAFIVCINSGDVFIEYSGYLDVFSSVVSALYNEDKELFKDVYSGLSENVYKDLLSYSEFFDKYRDSKASDIADSVNDKYLQMNGQEQGTKSYGLVTELCVAYYKTLK